MKAWVLLPAILMGCTAVECEPDRLPSRGQPTTSKDLFTLVQYAARNDCDETLYDTMSKRTRDEHSYLKLKVGIGSIEIPEPYNYKVLDVLKEGTYVGTFKGPSGKELVLVTYQEPKGKELLAQILVVEEAIEGGKRVKRMGLEEQRHNGPAFNQE